MKISHSWLKKYIDFKLTPEQLKERLTMQGIEVESIERPGEKYKNFVVGEVLEVVKHPRADKLSLCKVTVGKEILKIVCGAPNVATRQKVAVGLVGAVIQHDQHDPEGKPFVLSPVKIRGEESNGMICSEYELGLGNDADGILVLDNAAKVGQELAEYLGLNTIVYEIGVTPNRPDCLSHLGVAREVGALVGKKVKIPQVALKQSREKIETYASIKVVDRNDCPRYSARVVRNVKIGPSPKWLQDELSVVGIRPINNVVDITNYVLMETGHPLHAFDCSKLAGHKIIVKRAKDGERFVTLDGKERILKSDTLMICDAERPIAIAGVMGGANTEISEQTKNVLIESAYFNPKSIRRTSKHLGLSTEASQRFERGADSNITVDAVNRCAQLIRDLCRGEILQGVLDIYPIKIPPRSISLRIEKVNSILDTNLSSQQIISLLKKIEIKFVKRSREKLVFEVPTFRPDLEKEIDLIEEIARLYGYNKIKDKMSSTITFSEITPEVEFADEVRDWFIGNGYDEVVSNNLQEKSTALIASEKIVEVMNPISKDMAALRTSLVPSMLQVIHHNQRHGNKNLKLFEIGRAYRRDKHSPEPKLVKDFVEEERLIFALTGYANVPSWDIKERKVDIYDIRGEVETFFLKIFLDKFKFIYYSNTNTLTEITVGIEINDTYAGFFGKVRQDLLKQFDVDEDIFVCELDLDLLDQNVKKEWKVRALPKFPAVMRDLAFVVEQQLPIADLEKVIKEFAGELLWSIMVFDIYIGEQIPAGKKSCAFSLEFRSEQRTLTEEEVDRIVLRIVGEVDRRLHGKLRG